MGGKYPTDRIAATILFAAILPLVAPSDSTPIFEWKPLTRSNFSSEIRLHRHLLLLVTIPWSGESRALMRDIIQVAAQKRERYGELKLMFVHRNTEKMLADVLGANKEIMFFCYHYSMAYKYQGRLRAQNILMSAYHLMLLPPNELPFRHLNTESDLETFLQSTDKAILLFEFCGWTQFLLAKQQGDSSDGSKTGLRVQNMTRPMTISSDDVSSTQPLTGLFNGKEEQKTQGSDGAPLTCGIEKVHGHLWLDEFAFRNVSSSTTGDGGSNSCAVDEFERYESFFSMLVTVAREYFLPPDRFKYGLISRKGLISKLGVKEPSAWMLLIHFMGCPNCSKIFKHGDDLRRTLLTPHPLVAELEDTGHNLELSLPVNRPYIILFVDRASELSAVRKRSGAALKTFQKLVFNTQSAYQMMDEADRTNFSGFSRQTFPDKEGIPSSPSELQADDILWAPGSVTHQSSVALLFNKNEKNMRISPPGDTHRQNAHEILLKILQQKYPSLQIKGAEVHLLEGEDRFKMLSSNLQMPVQLQDISQANEVSSSGFTILNAQKREFSEISGGQSSAHGEESTELSNNMHTKSKKHAEQATSVIDVSQKLASISDHGNSRPNLLSSILKVLEGELTITKKIIILENVDKDMKSNHDLSSYYMDSCEQMSAFEYITSFPEDICPVKTIKDWICAHHTVGTVNNVVAAKNFSEPEKVETPKEQGFMYGALFFFSDGGYQSLKSLTGKSKIPSLVIVDPVKQQHYVFPEDSVFSYSMLIDFLSGYVNGSLAPFQRSEAVSVIPRQVSDATFGDHEMHEAKPLPRITVEEFSNLMLGDVLRNNNNTGSFAGSQSGFQSYKDIVVLFRNSWCGFCLRMELVVREVYHAFRERLSKLQKKNKLEDATLNGVPSFFRMDCTLNDCSAILKSVGQGELYPSLVLFPADKRNAVNYDGEISVSGIIDFVLSHGTADHLSGIEDILWGKSSKTKNSVQHSDSKSSEGHVHLGKDGQQIFLKSGEIEDNQQHLPDVSASAEAYEREDLGLGSFLIANDEINIASPFDKSKILIVSLDQHRSFHGLIVNKRLRWDVLRDLIQDIESLREAPLSYGGPVVVQNSPLISLCRYSTDERYQEILPGLFFGGHPATSRTIELIRSGNRSAVDFWFFLGYSSWEWQQLFNELAHGAWHLVNEGRLDWPES